MKKLILVGMIAAALAASAATVVDVSGVGNQKYTVQVNVGNAMFAKCLKKNLEISGLFVVGATGSIKVTGLGTTVQATGSGKNVSAAVTITDDKSARMEARKFANAMCEAFGQKGFALDKIVFLNRGKQPAVGSALPGEICVCYPDGFDIRQLTSDAKMTVFPRWKTDGESIFFISDMNGAPQIWEMNTVTGKRNRKWSFKGTPAGIAVSPDGSKVAAILSFQGNPELYILQGDRYIRLTNTPNASEGQPTWSPDGRKIAYVSDETRHPQIFVIDVATKAKRRLTAKGSQNVDPDWGKDGRITYITKRGGAQVAVMDASAGDSSSQTVTEPANWQHPSWARDGRHVVASRDKALFIIDTLEGGDKPKQLFFANGNWISPSWVK